jgi:hypothetical protein
MDMWFAALVPALIGAGWAVISPVVRHVLSETFTHPFKTSEIVRDPVTGEVSSFVVSSPKDRQTVAHA